MDPNQIAAACFCASCIGLAIGVGVGYALRAPKTHTTKALMLELERRREEAKRTIHVIQGGGLSDKV